MKDQIHQKQSLPKRTHKLFPKKQKSICICSERKQRALAFFPSKKGSHRSIRYMALITLFIYYMALKLSFLHLFIYLSNNTGSPSNSCPSPSTVPLSIILKSFFFITVPSPSPPFLQTWLQHPKNRSVEKSDKGMKRTLVIMKLKKRWKRL